MAKINESVKLDDVKLLSADAEQQLLDFADAVQLDFDGFISEVKF